MKYIRKYNEMVGISFKDAADYLKDILLELEDDGLVVRIIRSMETNYIKVSISNRIEPVDVHKYLDALASVNSYIKSVGLYISEFLVSFDFDNYNRTYKKFEDLERYIKSKENAKRELKLLEPSRLDINKIEIYIYR